MYRRREKNFPVSSQLNKAILCGEIIPWYQPIMDVCSGEVKGVEILARWQHPKKGVLTPDIFIPLAEHSGMITPMTLKLLEQVRLDMNALKFRLPYNFHVSININATTEMIESLKEALISFQNSFSNYITLVVEVSEGTEVEFDSTISELLKELRIEGIGIALDDFGTAFSNISRIDKLPVTCLKIDQSFIRRVSDSIDSQRLVESIIELAKINRLSMVAEGVETGFQSNFLMARGVVFQQGYYWSRPLPMIDFARFLIWHKKRPEYFSNL